MPADLLRLLDSQDIRCPAGELVGDCSVMCHIEEGIIDGRRNPLSVEAFCTGDSDSCPTWRADRERGHEVKSLLGAKRADASRARTERDDRAEMIREAGIEMDPRASREERIERAQFLLKSNSPEARAYRRKLGLIEWLPPHLELA